MILQRTKLAAALACATGAAAAVSTSAVYAQATTPDIRVEVTGSNIKRVENEGDGLAEEMRRFHDWVMPPHRPGR